MGILEKLKAQKFSFVEETPDGYCVSQNHTLTTVYCDITKDCKSARITGNLNTYGGFSLFAFGIISVLVIESAKGEHYNEMEKKVRRCLGTAGRKAKITRRGFLQ